MSAQEWIVLGSFCVVIVCSLLSIHWSRQATRNWRQTAEIYRGRRK